MSNITEIELQILEEKRRQYNLNNKKWYHQRKAEGRNIKIKKPEELLKRGPKPKIKTNDELLLKLSSVAKTPGRPVREITSDELLTKFKHIQHSSTRGRPRKIKQDDVILLNE